MGRKKSTTPTDIFPLPTDHAAVAKLIASYEHDVELTVDNTYLSEPRWKDQYESIALQLAGENPCGGKNKVKCIPSFEDYCEIENQKSISFGFQHDKDKIIRYVEALSAYYIHDMESDYFEKVVSFLFHLKKIAPKDTLCPGLPYIYANKIYSHAQISLIINDMFASIDLTNDWMRFLSSLRRWLRENHERKWAQYVWGENKKYFKEETSGKIDGLIREYVYRFNSNANQELKEKPLDIDLVGLRVGRWRIESEAKSKNGRRAWLCRCGCGTYKKLTRDDLLRKSASRRTAFSCGHCTDGSAYTQWISIKKAQTQVQQKFRHAIYESGHGGPGVQYKNWQDIVKFNGLPVPGKVDLDRQDQEKLSKDNTLPYKPGRTRWESSAVNRRNRRAARYLFTIRGLCSKATFADLAEMTEVSHRTLRTVYDRKGEAGLKARVKELMKQREAA